MVLGTTVSRSAGRRPYLSMVIPTRNEPTGDRNAGMEPEIDIGDLSIVYWLEERVIGKDWY